MLTELFNNENKGNTDLFCSRFSTDTDAVNYCVNTIDIHKLLKKELHKCIEIKTGSKHEKLTPREINMALIPFLMMLQNIYQLVKIMEAAIVSDVIRAPELRTSQ